MIRVNNPSVSCATPSEKSLSLPCRDVCNQAKALHVCDVNISPAEKHLFITLFKVLQRGQWRAAGSKRDLLGWQDGQAGSHHIHENVPHCMCPQKVLAWALKGSWGHRGQSMILFQDWLLMHPLSPQNFPVSCYRATSEEMWLIYRTFLYTAAFTSSLTLVSRELKELEVKYFKGKMHGKGEFSSPGERNPASVNTKQIMSCLLQVLPLPTPSVHLLLNVPWPSALPHQILVFCTSPS